MEKVVIKARASKAKSMSGRSSGAKKSSKKKVKAVGNSTRVSGFNESYSKLDNYFIVDNGVKAILTRNIAKCVNTLLVGPTGVGKTELAINMAKITGKEVVVFDMSTMIDPVMSLVGNHVLMTKDGVTESRFVPSRFSQVIQTPSVVVLDEISRAPAAANNLLFPCLDRRRELPMEYCFENSAPIKIHPECVFIATANVGSEYTGTHRIDRALEDRFFIIELEELDPSNIREVFNQTADGGLDEGVVDSLIDVFCKINQMSNEFKISFRLSIRHGNMIVALVKDGFTMYDAFYCICKGLGCDSDFKKTIKGLLNIS